MKRYVLQADAEEIEEYFNLESSSGLAFSRHYNIAPGVKVPILVSHKNKIKPVLAEWGIRNQEKEVVSTFFQEDVQEDGFISELLKTQPCVIPASGFYKWKRNVDDPMPFYLRVLSMDILAIPGVYTAQTDSEGKVHHHFAALTMPANALVEPLEKTMPALLTKDQVKQWLGDEAFKMAVKGFSGQHLLPHMAVYRVPDLVNNLSNNSSELIQPIPKLRDEDDDD